MERGPSLGGWAALVGIGALLAIQISLVRATNFSGYDEWFLIDQVGKGVVSIPYTNRPLHYLWALPARLLMPHRLEGFLLVHAFWLAAVGWLVFGLARRLHPVDPTFAFLAGAFAAIWAPLDRIRLSSTIGLVGYAGPTAAALAAILLLLEAFRRASVPFLLLAITVAALSARAFEGVLPLLACAPLLLLWTRPARTRPAWIAIWEGAMVVLLLLALAPLLSGRAAENYQLSGLGLDLVPWRVGERLLRQFGFHLVPLFTSPPREIPAAGTSAVLAVGIFVLALVAVWTPGPGVGRIALVKLGMLGVLLAALGYGVFVLSAAITTPQRMQFLSSAGIALLLASLVRLAGGALPSRVRVVATALLGGWIVAVGVGRTAALQREWDERSFYPDQSRTLVQLTEQAPGLRPGTLVVLLDDAGVWPASFTFRHAVEYLYAGRALGVVPGAHDLLYPWSVGPAGVTTVPWLILQGPWHVPPTLHRYDQIVIFRLREDRAVELQETWPPDLPALPPGARYAPRERILKDDCCPPERRILAGADRFR